MSIYSSETNDTKAPRSRWGRTRAMASALAVAGLVSGTLMVGQGPASALTSPTAPAPITICGPANIAISNAVVVEGTGAGFSVMTFTVTSTSSATSVKWVTSDGVTPPPAGFGAALAPADYLSSTGTLPLNGGPKQIHVFVRRDAIPERPELMGVRLFSPTGCFPNIVDGFGRGRILNDD